MLGCRLIKLEHAGHGLQVECATEINEELFSKNNIRRIEVYDSDKMFVLFNIDFYESIRINTSLKQKREVPEDYEIQIRALKQYCQHRAHCLIHDIAGLINVGNDFVFKFFQT